MNDERSANAVDRRLGQRVRTRRLEIGMSQERLAEILGVTFQQVQKYEKGVNRIAASRLLNISVALEMPIARLYEGLSPARRGASVAEDNEDYVQDALATPEGMQLMSMFASIQNAKVRRRVVELVRALCEEEAQSGAKKS
jgi:transcriptional regulator with XRE-family HTH domain